MKSSRMNKASDNHITIKDISFSLLAEGTTLKLNANGYSMYPSIKPGTIIFIEPFTVNNDPEPGEIVAWKRESGFVVHRLVRSERRGNDVIYYTRGDSCKFEDKAVTRDQIAGKVVRTENENNGKKEGGQLIRKPCYLINRMNVNIILIFKRFFNLFTDHPAPLKGG